MNHSIVLALLVGAFISLSQATAIASDNLECVRRAQEFLVDVQVPSDTIQFVSIVRHGFEKHKRSDADYVPNTLEEVCPKLAPIIDRVREANTCLDLVDFERDEELARILSEDPKLETIVTGIMVCGFFNMF